MWRKSTRFAYTIFHDNSVSRSHLNMIHDEDDMKGLLLQAPVTSSNNRYLVITKRNLTEQFISAAKLGTWGLFVVTNATSKKKRSSLIKSNQNGFIMALAFNTRTKTEASRISR